MDKSKPDKSGKSDRIFNGVIIGVLVALAAEIFKGFPVTKLLARGVVFLAKWLGEALSIPRWFLYVLLAASVTLLVLLTRHYLRRPPPWIKYRTDRFLDIDWRWRYWKDNTIQAGTVTPFCAKCAVEMVYGGGSPGHCASVECTECNYLQDFTVFPNEIRERIARLATRETENGGWKKALTALKGN